MEFVNARHILEGYVGVPSASTYYTNTGPSTMTEPHYEAIGILEEPMLYWKLRACSLLSRNVTLLCQSVARGDKSRLVLGHGGRKSCAIETLAPMR